MKKATKYLFLIFFSFLTYSGFSQFTLGPKVGLNYTNIIGHSDYRAGMDAGIFMRIGTFFYFQPEFDYSFRSSNFKSAYDEIENNFRLKTHNFDIPLLIGFKFFSAPNFNFRVFIGPRIGVLIDNSLENNSMKTVQIGGQAGIGIDIWRFTLDAKYDFSGNKYEGTSDEWWKQNMFNFALGFKFFNK